MNNSYQSLIATIKLGHTQVIQWFQIVTFHPYRMIQHHLVDFTVWTQEDALRRVIGEIDGVCSHYDSRVGNFYEFVPSVELRRAEEDFAFVV